MGCLENGVGEVSALALSLLWKAVPVILAAIGWLGARLYYMRAGAAKERAKQAAAEAKARETADDIQNDIGAMTPEQRREALRKWAKS